MLDAPGAVLNLDRVTDGFDADFVDGNLSGVSRVLYVGNGDNGLVAHGFGCCPYVQLCLCIQVAAYFVADSLGIKSLFSQKLPLFAMVYKLVRQTQA